MTKLMAAFLIVGVPFVLSVSWFLFWVVRIVRAGKKRPPAGNADRGQGNPGHSPSQSSSNPAHRRSDGSP